MTDSKRSGRIVALRLRPERAQALIHAIAEDTSRVILSDHALDRMHERGISDMEVYRLLRSGHVMEVPKRTERNEWKCKIIKRIRGDRDAGAVTIILDDTMLFVLTVEWEDLARR